MSGPITHVLQHGIDAGSSIHGTNYDVRMCQGKNAKYLIGETLAYGIHVAHVEFNFGKFVKIVHESLCL